MKYLLAINVALYLWLAWFYIRWGIEAKRGLKKAQEELRQIREQYGVKSSAEQLGRGL